MRKLHGLAESLNFIPNNRMISWKEEHFLWMCELQRWLREKHNTLVMVEYLNHSGLFDFTVFTPYVLSEIYHNNEPYKTYEEALEVGLQEALEIIKTNK